MGKNSRLSVKCVLITDKSAKNDTLSVNLSEILDRLVEQHCRLKKSSFYSLEIKKAGQSQSQQDLLRSALRLIQARPGLFPQTLLLFKNFFLQKTRSLLINPLRFHRLCNFFKASNVCAKHKIIFVTVFFCGLADVLIDICHYVF